MQGRNFFFYFNPSVGWSVHLMNIVRKWKPFNSLLTWVASTFQPWLFPAPNVLIKFSAKMCPLTYTHSFLFSLSFAGCILAELYTGYPLFPGENEVEQLACIMEVLGHPPDDLINTATRRRLFFGNIFNSYYTDAHLTMRIKR